MPSDIVLDDRTIDLETDELNCRPEGRAGSRATIRLTPKDGNITLGGSGTDGDLLIESRGQKRWIEITAEPNALDSERRVYINGRDSKVVLTSGPSTRRSTMSMTASSISCHRGFVRYSIASDRAVFQIPITVSKEQGSTKLSGHEIEVTTSDGERLRLVAEIRRLKREVERLRLLVEG